MTNTTWILLRHGQTKFLAERRYQGRANGSVLDAVGVNQTIELRDIVRKLNVSGVFCSPILRAQQTYDILSPALGKSSFLTCNELAEISIEGWEGRLKSDIELEDPNAIFLWRNLPHLFVDKSGKKPLFDLYSQARSFSHIKKLPGCYLYIGHDHINRALISTLLDLPIENHSSIPQAISSISIISNQHETGRPGLQVSNLEHVNGRAKHLDPTRRARLILMRHGVTHANMARVYQGAEDVPLSDLGHQQVYATVEIIKDVQPCIIVTSALARAIQSGKALPFSASIPRVADSRLNEFHYGRWQGCSDIDVENSYPEDLSAWRSLAKDRPIPDGESISNLVGRVSSILSELWKMAHTGGTVFVVAHDVVIRTLIAVSLHLSTRKIWSFPISNAGITEICMNDSGNTTLSRHNILAGSIEDRYGREYL